MPRSRFTLGTAALVLAGCAPDAQAQSSLASRVSAAAGPVQFSFAAREGVCGNGRTYYSTSPGSYSGTFMSSVDETLRNEPCVAGPVRVVLGRADGQIVDVDTYVGPPRTEEGVADLGAVPAREAVDYLLGLAARLEGTPSRAALTPAMLADSANPWNALLALARDQDRPLETRRSAVSWLARGAGASQADEERIVRTLLELARDAGDRQPVRERAVSALAGLEHGAGLMSLMTLVERGDDAWLRRQALGSIASSGDPRARRWLRETVQRGGLEPELQRIAVRGVGRSSYATGDDAEFLRAHYGRSEAAAVKEEVLRAVAGLGGAENERWLLTVARDDTETTELRRRAVQLAAKGENVAVRDLVALYDGTGDVRVRTEVIGALAARTDPAATDKLIAIARDGEDRTLQRQAINRLSRSEEPRVKEALAAIVTRPSPR